MATPLHHAVNWGHYDTTMLLLESGADPNSKLPPLNITALYLSIRYPSICRLLIDYGADVEVKNKYDITPLYQAITLGYNDVLEMLVTSNTINNKSTFKGHSGVSTPLSAAYSWNNRIAIKKLIELGADTSDRSYQSGNYDFILGLVDDDLLRDICMTMIKGAIDLDALYDTICKMCHIIGVEEIQMLIDRGFDVNKRSKTGHSLLSSMCHYNRIDAVRLLLRNGATINTSNITPLVIAINKGHTDIVILLMDKFGDDVRGMCSNGGTLLHIASHKDGNVDIVRFLIDSGINVNIYNLIDGRPAITDAIVEGNIDVVRLLLNNGVDLAIKDHDGLTIDEIAYWTGNKEIYELIRAKFDEGL